jgi:hypothetical protein
VRLVFDCAVNVLAIPGFSRAENALESRRDGLNLAQDAVLGWQAPLKSPVGTTEKRLLDREFSITERFYKEALGIAARKPPVVPTGLFVLRIFTQDCVLG